MCIQICISVLCVYIYFLQIDKTLLQIDSTTMCPFKHVNDN